MNRDLLGGKMRLFVFLGFFFFSFGASADDHLISMLASPSYSDRKKASENLKEMGFNALPFLKSNFYHEDLEVALKCREIYEEYLDLEVAEGLYPSIWFIGSEFRFPSGYEVLYNNNMSLCQIICKQDVSLEIYLEAKKTLDGDTDHGCNMCDCWHFWTDKKVERLATRLLAKRMLLSGKDKPLVIRMIEEAETNTETLCLMYQTKNVKERTWDFWTCPPGILIPKEEFVFPSY